MALNAFLQKGKEWRKTEKMFSLTCYEQSNISRKLFLWIIMDINIEDIILVTNVNM